MSSPAPAQQSLTGAGAGAALAASSWCAVRAVNRVAVMHVWRPMAHSHPPQPTPRCYRPREWEAPFSAKPK
eukprot:5909899-Pleurochrysis_carterae.AAC.1